MDSNTTHKILIAYSGVLTALLVVVVASGFTSTPKKLSLDQLDVKRINVVEPDGTLRLVIVNKASMPGNIVKGKEYKNANRNAAGMVFYNDEGSETGGLVFGGAKDANGKVNNFGHLSFDQYEQDQMFAIDAMERDGKLQSSIVLADFPQYTIEKRLQYAESIKGLGKETRAAAWAKFDAEHGVPYKRLELGRATDDSVGLALHDKLGRERITLDVAADGSPSLKLLDSSGNVISQLPEKQSRGLR